MEFGIRSQRNIENLDAFAFECTQTLADGGENVIFPAKR